MRAKTNILQLVFGFDVGGGELKLLELIRLLDKNKYNLIVVSVGKVGAKEEAFKALGYPTMVIPKKCRFDLTLPFKLAKIMRQYDVDLMMSTLFFADIIGAAATFLYKPKAFISWEVITGPMKAHQKLLYRIFANRFDKVVAVSNSIYPYIINVRKQPQEKIQTIYYGVDLHKFLPVSKKKKNGLIFGTVARLVQQKGHRYLLSAIPQVLAQFPGTRWQFVGTGPLEEELKDQAKELGIDHAVEFLGRKDDIPRFLREFDVFILPSLWEGFPNVLLEAMASGIPVIATAVEGTVELVRNNETGVLVEKENPHALADAMLTLLHSPSKVIDFGIKSRKRVEENFSLEKQLKEFEELYDSLASSNAEASGLPNQAQK